MQNRVRGCLRQLGIYVRHVQEKFLRPLKSVSLLLNVSPQWPNWSDRPWVSEDGDFSKRRGCSQANGTIEHCEINTLPICIECAGKALMSLVFMLSWTDVNLLDWLPGNMIPGWLLTPATLSGSFCRNCDNPSIGFGWSLFFTVVSSLGKPSCPNVPAVA